MGKLFDDFGKITFKNEAEVSQNFILPILQEYLGYSSIEIIPENHYPAKNIYSGVKFSEGGSKSIKHRPDFVVCLDGDLNDVRFIIDSKAPNERIDDHLGQLQSYSLSVGINLLMITNGKEIQVYDVNHLLFHSNDIEELQFKIKYLNDLLGRNNQSLKTATDIIKNFDYKSALSISDQDLIDREVQRKKLLLSDFQDYLESLVKRFVDWHLPARQFQGFDNLNLHKIDPNYLFSFRNRNSDSLKSSKEKPIKLPQIETDRALNIKIFIGETGSGKSCLLKFLTYKTAQNCLTYRDTKIPVFISLRDIGHGYKLDDLIVAFLNNNKKHCISLYDLPQRNDFIFYLDAFDEIGETFISETFSAIERLSCKYECYLTSRPNRIPQFKPSSTLDILSISELQVKSIARQHIKHRYYEFQRQLEKNNLKTETGNFLLLLLLISVFEEHGTLPGTISQVLKVVAERIKRWQESKQLHGKKLSWDAIEQLLGALGYRLIELQEVTLKKDDAEVIFEKTVLELSQLRKISGELTTSQIIEQLADIGLLIVNEDHIYFWHRLFLNYFASIGLKKEYAKKPLIVKDLAQDDRWEIVIIGLASQLPAISDVVTSVKENLWLAALCLAENNCCDTKEILEVVDFLVDQLTSIIPNIRRKAVTYLANIDHEIVTKVFFEAVERDYPSDVRMLALMIIGRSKTEEARSIIYKHLTWVKTSFLLGPSAQAHIARALYYYGEQDHLQIILNWTNDYDYFLDQECRNIFIELHSQQKLTTALITALENLFLSEYQATHNSRDKLEALAQILSLAPNDSFAEQLLQLPFVHDGLYKIDAIHELLKHYRSQRIIELLKHKILNITADSYVLEKLTEILSDSVFEVPKEVFYELITHPNKNIGSKSIYALRRFPYIEVKEEIEKHLYGDEPQLQSWALKVLLDNSEFVHFIRNPKKPSAFYVPTVHTMLNGFRRFNLVEGLPLMNRIFEKLSKNEEYKDEFNLAFDLARTYYFLSEMNKQAEIISWFFDGTNFKQQIDNYHFHLMKNAKYFDPVLSVQIAECYFRTYFPFEKVETKYNVEIFLETAEEIGSVALVPKVKKITESLISRMKDGDQTAKIRLERPMRALVSLAQTHDEDWILNILDEMKYNDGFEFPQLRRAVECLAYIGTVKSLTYIKQIGQQFKDNELVLNTCQNAFEYICRRNKLSFLSSDLFTYPLSESKNQE